MVKTNMYYEDNRDLGHNLHQMNVELLGLSMTFTTDAGVFSKSAIDYGSRILLENYEPEMAKSLLDVGCGYGTLGLTLSKKYELDPTMVDVNTRALDLTALNAQKNGIQHAKIFKSSMYDEVRDCYDSIVSNPPIRAGKAVVHGILEGSFQHLNANGHLTVVIQKKQGAPSAQKKMQEVFGNCEVIAKDKGYFILRSYKTN